MEKVISYLTSGEFVESIVLIVVGIIICYAISAADKKYFKAKAGNTKWYKSAKMVSDLINSIVVIVFALGVLSINGVNVGKYFRSIGVAGIILSFALQDILKDVIMGLSIMFEGYYKIGDVIEYNGEPGRVVSFNIKTTKLFMINTETTMSICNRNISQVGICSDWIDVDIPIGYDVDLMYSRQLCRECARRIERLRHVYSCDFLNTQELAESWINYRLRIHCLADKKPSVRRNSQAVIQDVFYEHNQEFPLSIKVLYNVEPPVNDKPKQAAVIEKDGTVIYDTQKVHRKKDYELGRGAAKSKVSQFNGTDDSIGKAITEAERYAISENLDNNMKLRIRLISEELLSLVSAIPIKSGSFFIEREGSDYEICFEADGRINKKIRDDLMSVSSNNTNEAYTGLSGMITHAIDSMILMSDNDKSGKTQASMTTMEQSIGKADDDYRWSYNIYKEKEQQAMDETDVQNISIKSEDIGKSVLTKLSDDIRISMRTNHVNIRVLVKSEEED